MDELVPQVDSIEAIYAEPSSLGGLDIAHQKRWSNLLLQFAKTYGHKPDYVARSPGRVNIIGEHIDYSLYNVLPTALTVDCLIAVKVVPTTGNRATVKISDIKPSKYESQHFDVPADEDVEIDASKHEWTNYFKSGLRGAVRFLRKQDRSFSPASMAVLVDGNVPAGGGLSSSAALVCASALAVMKANDHAVSKRDLLDLAIVSERAVGVYSGGMDQAASVFSKQGFLLYCRFFPDFQAEHVPFPPADPEITFLVAQSFVTSDKHVTAPKCYNLRVVECTLAAVVLAKKHDVVLNPDESSLSFSLRNFQEEAMRKEGRLSEPLQIQVKAVAKIADKTLDKEQGYTREDISKILGISVKTLEETYMSKFPVEAERFLLRQRALHVYEEAQRVLDFRASLTSTSESGEGLDEEKLRYLGQLMNATQISCQTLYDCSCPEIDEMCGIARRAGAYGSRLTGAGWGGSTVHMVPQNKVEQVIEALKKGYYVKRFPDIAEERLKEAIVISKPGQGSSLITGTALDAP